MQAPLSVQSNSPLEFVQQLFTKLGARYVVVTDTDGYCAYPLPLRCVSRVHVHYMGVLSAGIDEGIIDKKTWLAFLKRLEDDADD